MLLKCIIYFEELDGQYMALNLLEFISDLFRSIPRSLSSYLESILLISANDFFCKISSWNSQALADQEICKNGDYLLIQVKCFVFNQVVTKDVGKIPHTSSLTVLVTIDEYIVDHKKVNLIATINHSGKLARGHYSSFIKLKWSKHFPCNNAAVIP